MKKRILSVVVLFIAIGLLVGFSGGGSGLGARSGAPGEGTCISCHSSNALNSGNGSVSLSIAGAPTSYVAGQTYNLTLTVIGSSVNRYGFLLSARNSANNNAGTIVAGAGSQTYNSAGKSFISQAGTSTTGVFPFQWTAPAVGTGTVTFYFVGNAAENPAGTGGDNIYSGNLALPEMVTPPPSASFTVSQNSICVNNSVTITNTSTGAINSYAWNFGSGATPSTANTVGPHNVVYNSAGNSVVQLIVTGAGGTDTATVNLTVNDTSLTILPNQYVCNSANVRIDTSLLTNQNNCDSTVIQAFILAPSYNDTIFSSSCLPADTGVFSFQGVSQFGCDSLVTRIVSLDNFVSVNLTETGCGSVMFGGTVYNTSTQLADTVVGGAANGCDSITNVTITVNPEYNEMVNLTECDSINVGGITYFNDTTFQIILNTNANCDSVLNYNLTVNDCTPPNATINVAGGIYCVNQTLAVSTIADNDAVSFNWNFGTDATPATAMGEGPHNVNYTTIGSKTITLIVADAAGNTDTVTNTINVESCTSINGVKPAQVSIYPNPATDKLTIDLNNNTMHISIFNLKGSMLLSKQNVTGSAHINVSNLPKGIYYLKCNNANYSFVKKILIN